MAIKRGLGADEPSTATKRVKSSETPASRSATPADALSKVAFEVHYPQIPPNTKRQLSAADDEIANHAEWLVFQPVPKGGKAGELDQWFSVTPWKDWSGMKSYNNFIIQGETYKKNHYVYVRGHQTPKNIAHDNDKDFWVAKILQVRAANAQNVYALVSWMYWREELPPPSVKMPDMAYPNSGQRKYHGKHELIASNYMEVLDVLSFAGKADVYHWQEEDDQLHSKLYWRQTLNRATKELSSIREHCICRGHFNPEVVMEICDNPKCRIWLHDDCIIDSVLRKAWQKNVEQIGEEANGSQRRKTNIRPWKNKLTGKVKTENGHTTVTITDVRKDGKKRAPWDEKIECLKCGEVMD
ncbi:hypothetical protein BJ878DRAFT_416463 [Calycina marina]|uniref:BAH domain-containing protein n=1 Tax=Calycina marina TaxID=1763456 RepID=A0A9P7Z784_9HELO|nr:hypothetical protein BJ878DRAFT_416463 [Calycina marina]